MTVLAGASKFLICPLLVAFGDYLFAGVYYPGLAAWLVVGVVLAIFSIVSDMTLLDRLGHTGGFLADTAAATVWIWASQYILPGSLVTWGGALGTGIILGLSEILMHRWVQMNRRRGVRDDRP